MKTTICCLLTSATLALAACNSQPADKDMTEKDTTGASPINKQC